MRFSEIVESELVNPAITKRDWKPSGHSKNNVDSYGAYSFVEPSDDDEGHEVLVKNFEPMGTDLKMEFYKSMAHLMGANPYMPVVYNINQYMDGDYTSRNEFQMERLVPVEKMDSVRLYQALSVVCDHLGDVEGIQHLRKLLSHYDEKPESNDSATHLKSVHDQITISIIDELIRNNQINSLPNSPLKEFLSDLADFIEEHEANIDLHDENFLYRRTAHGAQLVIADPIDSAR